MGISTIGLGSKNILSNDMISKLKQADESAFISPLEKRKARVENQKAEIEALSDMMSTLSDRAANLIKDDIYQSVNSSVTGDSVSVNITGSIKPQNLNLEVISLATRDVFEAKDSFSSKDDTLQSGSMTLSIDGNDYDISIEDTDTLSTLVDKINSSTNGNIEASILNVGGDEPYKLIVKSTDTGAKNKISISSDSDSFANDFSRVGDEAQDALFKADGIEITRESNEVSDLIDGATFKLQKVGISSVSIQKDDSKLIDGIKKFVDQFNSVIEVINGDTKYDADKKTAGIFQGNNDFRNIASTLQDIVSTTFSKDGVSAYDVGLELQRDGSLSFDEDKFKKASENDSEKVKEYFSSSDYVGGLFNKFDKTLFDISHKSSGSIKIIKNDLDDGLSRYEEEIQKAKDRLDARYEILTKKFASYDTLLGGLNTQASTIDNLIKAQYANNN